MKSALSKENIRQTCQLTMSKALWNTFLNKDQQRNGVNHQAREDMYREIALQYNTRWPIGKVIID